MELREKIARLWWDTDYWPKTIGFRTDETTFENSIDQVKDECYFFADQIIALFQSHYLELAKEKGLLVNNPHFQRRRVENGHDEFISTCASDYFDEGANAQLVKVLAYTQAEVERARKEERARIWKLIHGHFTDFGDKVIVTFNSWDWQSLKPEVKSNEQ